MQEFCNYHKHDHISSIMTPDTHIKAEAYIQRAVELGHTTFFTTNHGTGGDIFEAKSLCDKYGLRCIFGVEGYIVPDPLEKDPRNYHIIIIPRTNKARKKVNLITSRANVEGFYYKPRIFIEDLLKLDKDDVYITTACVGGLLKDTDSFEKIFLPLAQHFKDNIYLEVQPHNISIQKEINSKCLALAKHGYKLIAANDSHYIYPEQREERDCYLRGKGINYPEEQGFILDYPSRETMVERFRKQNILTEQQIEEAIDNTLIFMDCEDIHLDKEIKMPSIYQDMTSEEKIGELKRHINESFKTVSKEECLKGEELKTRIDGIRYEMSIIEQTSPVRSMDYFLFNEKNTEIAINKYGGILTRTGRGSCGSFYLNKLLGMTQIDRFDAPVPLYPERFVSAARLLENRAIPDIDYNVVSQEPFVKASRELLGEHGCYPMVAYGTMQLGEAFRNICRSKDIQFSEYNEVAKDIESYENNPKWSQYINEAKKFVDCIVSASPHPCAHVLDNKDLREEYGIIRIGDALCVMVTSTEADEYKLLKNDYLIVTCWKLISETFAMLNMPIMTINELLNQVDDKVWEIYALGLTATLNQVDGEWATSLIKKYKPRNLGELSMFVACLRPFFNSNRDDFIDRKPHTTGSKHLDEILKDTNGYILFQESLMKYFEWLGVTPAESIGLIKKISKKKIHKEDFDSLTERLRKQWIINTGSEDMFDETFADIQSCMSYGFAAPHALAVAIDSLYSAYLKVYHPLEYYTVSFNNYASDEDKTKRLTEELKHFGIRLEPIKFRYSSGDYVCDKESNSIYKGIGSIKHINNSIGQALYDMRNDTFNTFVDFLDVNPCNTKQTKILISLDFFSEFGKSGKLMKIFELYTKYANKKTLSKSKLDIDYDIVRKFANETPKQFNKLKSRELLNYLVDMVDDVSLSPIDIINSQKEYLGYVDYIDNSYGQAVYVLSINTKYSPVLSVYSLRKGTTTQVKMSKKLFNAKRISEGVILKVNKLEAKCKYKKNPDGTFTKITTEKEWWITDCVVMEC